MSSFVHLGRMYHKHDTQLGFGAPGPVHLDSANSVIGLHAAAPLLPNRGLARQEP